MGLDRVSGKQKIPNSSSIIDCLTDAHLIGIYRDIDINLIVELFSVEIKFQERSLFLHISGHHFLPHQYVSSLVNKETKRFFFLF